MPRSPVLQACLFLHKVLSQRLHPVAVGPDGHAADALVEVGMRGEDLQPLRDLAAPRSLREAFELPEHEDHRPRVTAVLFEEGVAVVVGLRLLFA